MIHLVRYAEIALKGNNRSEFEKKLVANMKAGLKATGLDVQIKRLGGRFLLHSDQEVDLRRVFGIVSYSPCMRVKADLQDICSEALQLAEQHKKGNKTSTFRISSRRLTKDFPLSSVELNSRIGAFIAEKTGFKVDLSNPELDIGIELIGSDAFLFTKTIGCFGGLPVGIEGKVLAVISDLKSVLAALLMMKRGCAIEVASFSEISARELSFLQAFCPYKLVLHCIKDASELNEIAMKLGCKALVVGDTLHDFSAHPINILILRPLIAFSDSDIDAELDKFRKACC
jgi:thiamine biosynthesis protein ThiI